MKPVAIGATIGVALAVASALPMLAAVESLARARSERAAIEAQVASPVAADATMLPVATDATRRDALTASGTAAEAVRRSARSGGVLVERIERWRQPAQSRLVVLRLVASGPEKAVLVLADTLSPPARWRRWQLVALPGGAVRLDGELLVPRQ